MEEIVLVDENDKEIGLEEKLKAHQNGGKLHRAFSVFVFNSKGELMLQKRAKGKYHSELLWTNTCCSHPRPGEKIEAAVRRRLKEEMGFSCDLTEKFSFIYKVDFRATARKQSSCRRQGFYFGNGLSENEFDHVFFGRFDGEPKLNPEVAADWRWIKLEELKKDIEKSPEKYSHWLKVSLNKILKYAK